VVRFSFLCVYMCGGGCLGLCLGLGLGLGLCLGLGLGQCVCVNASSHEPGPRWYVSFFMFVYV